MMLICSFCNRNFTIDYTEYNWFYCSNCNVSYKMNNSIIITRFHILFKDTNYGIDLCHNIQETHVIKLPHYMDELILIILILPYMTGITPDNCLAKLETLLTFS